MTPRHAPVLIVGAGFVGLTAALMLSHRKIPCLVVERRAALSNHPRAHGLNLRTLELFRQVPGLEEDIHRAARATPEDLTILIGETVSGPPIKTLCRSGVDVRNVSPSVICSAGQDRVEPVLLHHARRLGADIRFATELVSFKQHADCVHAILRDGVTGDEMITHSNYLIAGDGSGSAIRKSLGISMNGRAGISHAISIHFEADLKSVMSGRRFLLCYLRSNVVTGAFVSCDDPDRGQLNVEYDPQFESPTDFDETRCQHLVRAALGLTNIDVNILNVIPWRMSALVAERMSVGRVFLAGDAAHIMPPVGGLGGQAAIQDAADLAWKIAMTLNGYGTEGLLETYDSERRPVAQLIVARATENYVERIRQDRNDLSHALGKFNLLDVSLSYRYRSDAISLEMPDDGLPTDDTLCPSGKPGTRLAHVSLIRDGRTISTHDVIGQGYILFAGPDAGAWMGAAQEVANSFLVPLAGLQIGVDILDEDDEFVVRTGIKRNGAILARPDGFIAWRSISAASDPFEELSEAVKRALCRETLQTKTSRYSDLLGHPPAADAATRL